MSNQNIRRATIRVYVDDRGNEFVSSTPFRQSELAAYSLVHEQQVVVTFPKYNKNEHRIRALQIRASLYGDNAKAKQVELYEEIQSLGGSDE